MASGPVTATSSARQGGLRNNATPYILWATLIPTAIGFVGQIVQLGRLKRDKTIDWVIVAADAAILVCTLYLLFAK